MSRPDPLLKIERAQWWALSENPFYGALLMRLEMVLDPATQTASTNGRQLRINPDWALSLSDEELRFVLLHETLHCAHLHMWRLPADERGNIAGDHEINLTLTGADGNTIKGISMPAAGLCDRAYAGLSCEEILARLPESPPGGGGGQQPGQGGAGQPDPCGGFTAPQPQDQQAPAGQQSAQAAQLKDQWETAVAQAAQAAQALGKGNIPADMARALERLRAQPIDWKQELADFIRQAGAGRADWTRSARRYAWQSVIYPRRRRDGFSTIIIARDTSGSITDQICAEFSAAVDSCAAETHAQVVVLDCDAKVKAEHRLEPGEPCPLRAVGGGGTDFRPVFDRAAELVDEGENVAGIIYLTDLEGPEPDRCDLPVLWISTTAHIGKVGRTVRMLA